MEAICTTNTVVEPTEQTPELPYVNNTELIKLQESFDDALVYSAWYGVAMPTVAAVGVVLNAMAFSVCQHDTIRCPRTGYVSALLMADSLYLVCVVLLQTPVRWLPPVSRLSQFRRALQTTQRLHMHVYALCDISQSLVTGYTLAVVVQLYMWMFAPMATITWSTTERVSKVLSLVFTSTILVHLLHFFKFVQDRTVIGGVSLTQVCLSDMYTNDSFHRYDNYVYFVVFVFLPYAVAAALTARVCLAYARAALHDCDVVPPAFRVFKDVSSRTNGAVAALYFVLYAVNNVAYVESMRSPHYVITSRECRMITTDRRFVFSPRLYELLNSVALVLNSSTKFLVLFASRRQFRYVVAACLQTVFTQNVVVDVVRGVFTIRHRVAPPHRSDVTDLRNSDDIEMRTIKVG